MSRLIKNSRGYLGLGIFLVGLWAIVVVSYARQVKQSDSQTGVLRPLAQESCSSSSSGSSGSSGNPEP